MRIAAVVGVAVTLLTQAPAAQPGPPPAVLSRPKLVVILAVDQMRADYIDRFRHQWSGGLKRLVAEGAWFRQADYPYYNTVTCAGHASISTGALPSTHGMIQNRWWVNGATRAVQCTDDASQTLVSYGHALTGTGQSAARLLTTTLSDELRLQNPVAPRVVSISLKARSAIMLAGHRPDAVIWQDEETGEWTTSTAFSEAPAPYFAAYITAHDVTNEVGRTWDRALAKEQYLYPVSTVGQQKLSVGNAEFPHVIKGTKGALDKVFTDAWESSPFSDAYLAGLAAAALDGLKLGRGPGTDYLGVSFSALDKVGHDFGPDSHEIQDVLIRLDREVATLLDKLDRDVGRGRYVVALSADHGVSPVPERVKALGFDAGRIDTAALGRAVDRALAAGLGPGEYRTRVNNTDIYLNAGVYERLVQQPKALDQVLEVVRTAPGVTRVFTKDAMAAAGADADPLVRAAARSYYPGRSGDLLLLQKAYWTPSLDTTSHGSAHRYDTHVPVVLYGAGIKRGEYLQPAAPIDIAPTLAFLLDVVLPDAAGRVLTEALVH